MIITCPNCNKQFMIDNSMIPHEGRNLQCGSCNHVWFYKIEEQNTELLKLDDEIESENIKKTTKKKKQIIEETELPLEKVKTETKNELKEKISQNQENKTTSKNIANKGSKFFSYLMVFIISFIALIILLDTLKKPLINVLPGLEIILFNLFETVQDIKLFIIDLI